MNRGIDYKFASEFNKKTFYKEYITLSNIHKKATFIVNKISDKNHHKFAFLHFICYNLEVHFY